MFSLFFVLNLQTKETIRKDIYEKKKKTERTQLLCQTTDQRKRNNSVAVNFIQSTTPTKENNRKNFSYLETN